MELYIQSKSSLSEEISIRVHPKNVPELRGLKNGNIGKIKMLFDIKSVFVVPDPSLPAGGFVIDFR